MRVLSLNEGWSVAGRDAQPADAGLAALPDETAEWLSCPVPGDVNAVLVAAGKMPNPHFDDNGRQCYWVTDKEWWLRKTFELDALPQVPSAAGNAGAGASLQTDLLTARAASAPVEKSGASADLCLDGVDGTSEIWLNRQRLGEMKNAFREHRFPVAPLLRLGANEIIIRFRSIDQLMGGPRLDELNGWDERTGFLRRPLFNMGWDWALPLPSIGLAGGARIEMDNAARLADVGLQTFMSGRVDFFFEVTPAAKAAGYEIRLAVKGHGADIRESVSRDTHRSYVSVHIPDPRLWWPNGYGEQPLYDWAVELRVGGRVVERRKGRLGLRESRIEEEPFTPEAGPGRSFNLVINNQRIFCKGGNWVPLELWPGVVRDEQYDYYLRQAKAAHFNMMRVWGGGVYERERFYDLCDELGIVVWQDFMFASMAFPVDLLRDEITQEALYQIRRLRNRASVALWCGCNEDVFSWEYHSLACPGPHNSERTVSGEGQWRVDRFKDDPQIYTMILRGLVGRFGLAAPYTESSPQSHDDSGNMPHSGNCHISCWKYSLFETSGQYERWRGHFEQPCSFDSEFCIQGPCAQRTIKRFLSPANHWPPNDIWTYHVQRGHRRLPHHEQTLSIAGATFGEIKNLADYVKHGQATHAEMMRAEFESARRDRPNNGGTMMWMFNDCWPTSNWSIIDYDRLPKPSFYAARRACAPHLPIIFQRGGKIEFFVGNDTLAPARIRLIYGQESLNGQQTWTERGRFTVPPNSTHRFASIDRASLSLPPGDFLFIETCVGAATLDKIAWFPDGWRDVVWPEPRIAVEETRREKSGGRNHLYLRVTASVFARFCHLRLKDFDPDVLLSDNFFDLCAGHSRIVIVDSRRKLSVKDFVVGHWATEWE